MVTTRPAPTGPRHAPAPRGRPRSSKSLRRRRFFVALAVLLVLMTPIWWSLGSALTNPSLGTSTSARLAEWARDHHMAPVVNWVENFYYSHHQPPKGGKPPPGEIPKGTTSTTTTVPQSVALPVPAAITPPASPPLPGEGQWHPAGRTVNGVPAVYEAFVRPDTVHTSFVAGIAWMDTKLLRATLYSGSYIPGGGPWTCTAPIPTDASNTLVAAFNAGFRLQDSLGGYYTQGQTVSPLVDGKASFVIYKDGTVNIGAWGSDVTMASNVVSVRQNLSLLVANGAPAGDLSSTDNTVWGPTLGGAPFVWRSGVGVTANGALVYVGGPSLNIVSLADLLVRAGAVRAMELDINTDWVNFATYAPTPDTAPASAANGTMLLNTMNSGPDRYFASWWSRDFFTMSAAVPNASGGACGGGTAPGATSTTTTAPSPRGRPGSSTTGH